MTNKTALRAVQLQIYLLALTACATTGAEKPPIYKIVPIRAELVVPVAVPELQGDTNSALVDLIEQLRAALGLANDRLRSIGNIR